MGGGGGEQIIMQIISLGINQMTTQWSCENTLLLEEILEPSKFLKNKVGERKRKCVPRKVTCEGEV